MQSKCRAKAEQRQSRGIVKAEPIEGEFRLMQS